ncbi:hypothetical protein [Rhodanobacter sp. L36]|uniref:hypothetical protein n=1 Tax=Rhodanobacter sp. L36 TaxID=1747221 RepID=UPI00131DD24D|nr:hypothetical protein [Rhodanobacter sp. L36]
MKRLIATCVVSAVLASCASLKWSKPDGDYSNFEQDKAQCEYDVDLHTQNGPFNPFATRSLLAECMRARGYVQQ